MSVRSSTRRRLARLFAGLFVFAALALAGCSFEAAQTGLECGSEGATRPGEVCRDGYWRIVEDASLDANHRLDAGDAADHDATPPPTDTGADSPDGCTPLTNAELCRRAGNLCDPALEATDPCTGQARTVDCTVAYDFDNDPNHCGGCDNACAADGAHTVPACEAGQCTTDCEDGWRDINGDAADGCESQCSPTNGGVEICDGVDNDCDGQRDESDAEGAQTYYRDADGDGHGTPSDTVRACNPPNGYVADGDDCDDTDAQINPEAAEVCDGAVDENCNQRVDEDCPCSNGDTRPCGTDQGTCKTGTQSCDNGQWSAECVDEIGPTTEMCDGKDNDCDGATDEDFTRLGNACTGGQGACQSTGTYVCATGGTGVICNATAGSPSSEVCDGVDNDCDGQVDEDFASLGDACTAGQGACQASGAYVCDASGAGVTCGATAGSPAPESCDGVDNDCDGQVDEDFANLGDPCTAGQGACANSGTYECAGDGASTVCSATAGSPASTDTCGDGIDNDCDGQVDQNCGCNYDNRPLGVCADATVDASGQCQQPADYERWEQSCDGLDNDCDGAVDEGLTQWMYPDADGDGYGAASGTTGSAQQVCPGTPGFADQYGDCDDGDPWTHPNAEEICDGKDNNCNGREYDDGGNQSSSWCSTHYPGSNTYCGGPNSGVAHLCCEISNDGNLGCDYESVCDNGVDEDGDGQTDCADADCDGLSCGDGTTCQSGSCQPI